jgi:hypothetical protein
LFDFLFKKTLVRYEKENEKELEDYRSLINLKHSVFASALDSYFDGYKITTEHKIESIEKLWNGMLEIREQASDCSVFYNIIHEKEYDSIFTTSNPKIKTLLDGVTNSNWQQILRIKSENEVNRVFLGEEIWALFEVYVIVSSRPIFLLVKGKEKKEIMSIKHDEHLKSFLDIVFTKEENEKFYQKDFEFLKEISMALEQKILLQMSKVISGEKASESNLERSRQIIEKLAELPSQRF